MNMTELVVEIGPEKKIEACTGFKPMTSAIPVQHSANCASEPTESWSICWVQINHPSDE